LLHLSLTSMQFGAGVCIQVVGMNVIFQMELVSTYFELYNSRYKKKKLSQGPDWHSTRQILGGTIIVNFEY
jgi:hypothetical protein